MGAAGSAVFKLNVSNYCTVPAVDRLTVELLGLLASIDVSCIVLCGNLVCC